MSLVALAGAEAKLGATQQSLRDASARLAQERQTLSQLLTKQSALGPIGSKLSTSILASQARAAPPRPARPKESRGRTVGAAWLKARPRAVEVLPNKAAGTVLYLEHT